MTVEKKWGFEQDFKPKKLFLSVMFHNFHVILKFFEILRRIKQASV